MRLCWGLGHQVGWSSGLQVAHEGTSCCDSEPQGDWSSGLQASHEGTSGGSSGPDFRSSGSAYWCMVALLLEGVGLLSVAMALNRQLLGLGSTHFGSICPECSLSDILDHLFPGV